MQPAQARDSHPALPPLWVLGLTEAPFGLFFGFAVFTLPELLAAQGVTGGHIAAITATILSPAFWVFLIAPMLDVRLSRRDYALIFGPVAAAAAAFTVLHHGRVALVEIVMTAGSLAISLYQSAVGGWVGSLIGAEHDSALGSWFNVFNTGAAGVSILLGDEIAQHLPPLAAAAVFGLAIIVPMAIFLAIPAPGPDRQLARESFAKFWREVGLLLERRDVLWALALFLLPSASFALTNILGGLGKDFATGAHTESLLGSVGTVLAGLGGSFLLRPLARRIRLRPIYLGVGIVGALFTASLLLLPRDPWTFGLAYTGENTFQALSFATSFAITFEVIGPANPLASTTFCILTSAINLPITYMGYIDGIGYNHGGMVGCFLTDAGISLAVCLLLFWALRRFYFRPAAAVAPAGIAAKVPERSL